MMSASRNDLKKFCMEKYKENPDYITPECIIKRLDYDPIELHKRLNGLHKHQDSIIKFTEKP
jgi:hypothetical protein